MGFRTHDRSGDFKKCLVMVGVILRTKTLELYPNYESIRVILLLSRI